MVLAMIASWATSASAGKPSGPTSPPTSYSGSAYAVQYKNVPIIGSGYIENTGSMSADGSACSGGSSVNPADDPNDCDVALLNLQLPPDNPAVIAEVLSASTQGSGNQSNSSSSVAKLILNLGGHVITAGVVEANAHAECTGKPRGPQASSDFNIVRLNVDGKDVIATGPNQTINLLNGLLIIDEVSYASDKKGASADVTGLHLTVPNPIDGGNSEVLISHSHADITCGTCPKNASNFVTGGGFIDGPNGDIGTFGVTGGYKNNSPWGHLVYIDHGNGMKVQGQTTSYTTGNDALTRVITGDASVNGTSGYHYTVTVSDYGEPGINVDKFSVHVTGPGGFDYSAGGLLQGGNIQLHRPFCP